MANKMKRMLLILAMMCLALGICSCGKQTDGTENSETGEGQMQEATYTGVCTYVDETKLRILKSIASPDGKLVVGILGAEDGRIFYAVTNEEELVMEPSMLGIVTSEVDFSIGTEYVDGQICEITDEYTLLNGKHEGSITDICNQYTFTLKKSEKELTIHIRVYDEGVAYNYAMNEGATIQSEAGEFVFSDESTLWSYTQPNVTYEGTYTSVTMDKVRARNAIYTLPSLIETGENWVLVTEASVFDDEESYCSSYLKTSASSKNLKWIFGNKQESAV